MNLILTRISNLRYDFRKKGWSLNLFPSLALGLRRTNCGAWGVGRIFFKIWLFQQLVSWCPGPTACPPPCLRTWFVDLKIPDNAHPKRVRGLPVSNSKKILPPLCSHKEWKQPLRRWKIPENDTLVFGWILTSDLLIVIVCRASQPPSPPLGLGD